MCFTFRYLRLAICALLFFANDGICQSKEHNIEKLSARMEERPDSVFQVADSLARAVDSTKYPLYMAQLHEIIAALLFQRGVHDQALSHLLGSKLYWERTGNEHKKAWTLISLGEVYYYLKKPELAQEVYEEAAEIFTQLNVAQGIGSALNHLGHLAEKQGDFQKAIALQESALSAFNEIGDKQGKAQALEGLGSIYEDEENYALAEAYFLEAFQLNEQRGDKYATLSNLNNLGDVYRKMGKLESAAMYTRQAVDRADSLDAHYQKSSALRDLAKVHFEAGDYKSAYLYLEMHRKEYRSIYQNESNLQVNMLQALYASSKKDRLIQKLEKRQEINRIITISVLFILLLIAVIVYILVSKQRSKLVSQKIALQRDLDQHEKEQIISNIELENARLSEQKLMAELELNKLSEKILNQELNQKTKELTSHTLQIIRKTKFMAELRDKLKLVHTGLPAGQPKKTVKEMLSKLEGNLVQEKEWSLFRKVFEEVHDGYFQVLFEKHGTLSASEMRLCALIKLNLSSRDIAISLGISDDSLRIARYRLKKRLGLQPGEKLATYLRMIGPANSNLMANISVI